MAKSIARSLVDNLKSWWWFVTFFIFPNSWDDDPIWRTPSFFRGVGQPPIRMGAFFKICATFISGDRQIVVDHLFWALLALLRSAGLLHFFRWRWRRPTESMACRSWKTDFCMKQLDDLNITNSSVLLDLVSAYIPMSSHVIPCQWKPYGVNWSWHCQELLMEGGLVLSIFSRAKFVAWYI